MSSKVYVLKIAIVSLGGICLFTENLKEKLAKRGGGGETETKEITKKSS